MRVPNICAWVIVCACLAGVSQVHAAGKAGTVMYALGDTSAVASDGSRRALARGDVVAEGDRLETAAGSLQVRLEDGGLITLQPNSRFVIETYTYAGREDGSENAIFRLLQGGLRAATGAIGRVNRSHYLLRTTWATVGIRGTTYKARICAGDCPVPDGLYASGGEGVIVVMNDAGEIELTAGENAYVETPNSAPVATTLQPDVADISPLFDTRFTMRDSGGPITDTNFIAGQAVFQASISGVAETLPLRAAAGAVSGEGSVSGAGRIGGARLDGQSRSGAILGSAVFSEAGEELDVLNASFNAQGGIIGITGSRVNDEGRSESGAIFVTNTVDVATDGILYLGRWTESELTAFADGGYSARLNLDREDHAHYIATLNEVRLPASGSASYTFNGLHTASTGTDSSLGRGLVGGRIDVDFGLQNASSRLRIDHGGRIDIETHGEFRSGHAAFDTAGNATGSGCRGGCEASVDGFLAGPGAIPNRAGVSYQVEQARRSIVGVGGFSRARE